MAGIIPGEASPNPTLETRVKAIRAALDDLSMLKHCYCAVEDLVCPTAVAEDLHVVDRNNLSMLLSLLNRRFTEGLDEIEEEFRDLWTEVFPS